MFKKLVLFLMAFASVASFAQDFTDAQKKAITCARERTYAIYKFFEKEVPPTERQYQFSEYCGGKKDSPVKIPDYLVKEMPEMMQTPLRFEGAAAVTHVETDAWRQYFANLNVVLEIAENMWDDSKLVTPAKRREKLVSSKAALVVALDRLNTLGLRGGAPYSLKDSMEGRGRLLIPTFDLIGKEMDSVLESFSMGDEPREKRFVDSMMAITILTNDAYNTFFRAPPIPFPDGKFVQSQAKQDPKPILYLFIGVLVVFFGVFTVMSQESARIEESFGQYLNRSNAWADDFNRQFSSINVKYLVLGTVCGFAVFGMLIGFFFGGIGGILIFALFTFVGFRIGIKMPATVLKNIKQSRGRKVNVQIMDALILLSNSLKSGMDIVQGFEMVSKDSQPPISEEFGLVIKNYQLGTTFEKALEGMEERVESRLLSYMIKAIVLQRQVGGNLTKIFERIVENIREESKLEDKLQSLTAQQKIQSIVVAVMPWIMVGVMFMFRPDTMLNFYLSGVGFMVLLFCIGWMFIGMKLVGKLGEIKV